MPDSASPRCSSPEEVAPLVRSTAPGVFDGTVAADGGNAITQYLGGRAFTVDPSRFDPEPLSLRALPSRALALLKPAAALALSPLLLFSAALHTSIMCLGPESFRHRLLAAFIPKIMCCVAEKFRLEREHLLSDVREGDRVLDVGSGGGAYLRHLYRASEVVALEPVEAMHPKIRRSASDAGIPEERLTVLPCGVEEYLERNPDRVESFDWIILGNVLCEVRCQDAALRAVDGLLRPGTGRAYFSEHIGAPRGSWGRALQERVNPWWRVVSGGCNCNRDTVELIRSVKGWDVVHWEYPSLRVGMGMFVLGLARKAKGPLPQ